MICASCSEYYRLTKFHTDVLDCEDCSGIIPESQEEFESEIFSLLSPSGKTLAHITDSEDD